MVLRARSSRLLEAGDRRGPRPRITLACWSLLTLAGAAAAREIPEGLGARVYPDASSQAATARAVEAYYRPGIAPNQNLIAEVFETAATFQAVYHFYGPQMDTGKWGWRRKTRTLLQQAETLKFMRAQLLAQRGTTDKGLPEVFRPLFGDPDLDQQEFAARLDDLCKANRQATIQVVEGTRTVADGSARGQVRVTVERPYIDVETMKLVDRTRVVLVKVSERSR